MSNKRTFFKVLSIVISLSIFTACEKADVDFDEPNMIKRLETFHGENISSVSRLMKKKGYINMDLAPSVTNFVNNKDQYSMYHNTADKKTINVAAYMRAFESLTDIQTKYAEWKNLIVENGVDNRKYIGQIKAMNFQDFDKNYIAVDTINDTTFVYIYDNELYFSSVYMTNMINTTFISETWYDGERNKGKELNVKYSMTDKVFGSKIVGNTSLINADYTIK